MKIISTKEYNKLKETQSAYLDLLWKPFQGVFEKVTDDDLLRENGLLNAKNERLNNIINELEKDIDLELYKTRANDEYNEGLFNAFRYVKDKLDILKGEDKE